MALGVTGQPDNGPHFAVFVRAKSPGSTPGRRGCAKVSDPVRTCAFCPADGSTAKMTKHHVYPKECRPKGAHGFGQTKDMCRRCHRLLHLIFSNKELAALGWEGLMHHPVIVELVQHLRGPRL